MYTCPKCEAVVRTRQGLGGHMRFRHPLVEAPANHRAHRPTAFELDTKEKLATLSRSIQSLTSLVSSVGLLVCQIADRTPGVDPERLQMTRSLCANHLLPSSN